MDVVTWLNVVGGMISIIAFVASAWVWLSGRHKLREATTGFQMVYNIADTILWELTTIEGEDTSARLRHASKSLGKVSTIHEIVSHYALRQATYVETELGMLCTEKHSCYQYDPVGHRSV